MLGRVKIYYEDKKFGFIIGEDGYEYFFHITNVISVDLPTSHSLVEFEPTTADRGKKAINVKVTQKYEQRPQYINIGSYRIKISAIKNYWTDKKVEKHYREHLFKMPEYIGETTIYYIFIRTSKDAEYDYRVKFTNKEEFLAACKVLDNALAVVNIK